MLRRLGIFAAVLAVGLMPASAGAAPRDAASTHAYLLASYAILHATVAKWSSIEASISKLDQTFSAECLAVGAGSPQSEEEQKLSDEVVGAIWATAYHAEAKIIQVFVKAVKPLRWSNPSVTHSAQKYIAGLREMAALQVPDLCADVRAWGADGFKAVPADTAQYDRHVEAIEVNEVPRNLLAPYVQPSDRGLFSRVEHLAARYDELEFSRGESDWNTALEILALNQ
jgi:hypothetical protein